MPNKTKSRPRARRKRKAAPGIATRPKMMTNYTKRARWNNVSSKIFYLKDAGEISPDLAGVVERVWGVQEIYSIPQFATIGALYTQFKVLGMTVRLYPANVGIEPDPSALPVGANGLFRGNAGVWSDQRPGPTVQFPTSITGMINYGSAKLINPRRPYTRTMYRASGFPTWGGIAPTALNDSWRGTINLLQVDATASTIAQQPVLWYWSRTLKVVFRGRRST